MDVGTVVNIWIVGTILSGVVGIFGVLCAVTDAVDRGQFDRHNARMLLRCLGGIACAWTWPVVVPIVLVNALTKVWRIAEMPTLSQRRERKKAEKILMRDNELKQMRARVAELEREAGIAS